MAVDQKDREAYERGLEVNKQDVISRFISDQASVLFNSESEKAAYEKARSGQQLDGDRVEKDTKR